MTHIATKPAFAPSAVVAINSPDPTIEADRIKPGPRYFDIPAKFVGGSSICDSLRSYGFIQETEWLKLNRSKKRVISGRLL
jgi:hypothetical protein